MLADLLAVTYANLLDELADTISTLIDVLDQIGFVKAQELDAAGLAWSNEPSDSIQKKDRQAKYASAIFTSELFKLEAQRDSLIERKFFIIRLLDDARTGVRST